MFSADLDGNGLEDIITASADRIHTYYNHYDIKSLVSLGLTSSVIDAKDIKNSNDFKLFIDGSSNSGVSELKNFELKLTHIENNLDELNGTNADDIIYGTNSDDIINGFDGDDRIYGLAGPDNIHGGLGNDNIRGGAGNDVINGADGEMIFLLQEQEIILLILEVVLIKFIICKVMILLL